MADVTTEVLKEEIAAILKDANLAKTSAKKVREQLQNKLKIDLSERKKEVDNLVMDYVNSQEAEEEEDEEEEIEAAKSEEEEQPIKKTRSSGTQKKKIEKPKKTGKRSGSSGYTKAYNLSPALSNLMGEKMMPRHEVVKRVWALIKERNLYDPNNKQFAICDDDLYKVIGIKRFRTFGMMKYLKTHFHD